MINQLLNDVYFDFSFFKKDEKWINKPDPKLIGIHKFQKWALYAANALVGDEVDSNTIFEYKGKPIDTDDALFEVLNKENLEPIEEVLLYSVYILKHRHTLRKDRTNYPAVNDFLQISFSKKCEILNMSHYAANRNLNELINLIHSEQIEPKGLLKV